MLSIIIIFSERCAQSLSHTRLFEAPWAVACQPPLPMEFSREEYWSGVLFSAPGNPLNLGMEPASLASPALAGRFFTTRTTWEALILGVKGLKLIHYEEQARWNDFMGSIAMRNVSFF